MAKHVGEAWDEEDGVDLDAQRVRAPGLDHGVEGRKAVSGVRRGRGEVLGGNPKVEGGLGLLLELAHVGEGEGRLGWHRRGAGRFAGRRALGVVSVRCHLRRYVPIGMFVTLRTVWMQCESSKTMLRVSYLRFGKDPVVVQCGSRFGSSGISPEGGGPLSLARRRYM